MKSQLKPLKVSFTLTDLPLFYKPLMSACLNRLKIFAPAAMKYGGKMESKTNNQSHRKLKHDCNKDKVGDLILLSNRMTRYSTFSC